MPTSEFVAWFGNELRTVVKNADHVYAGRELISRAIKRLEEVSSGERKEIADQLKNAYRTGMFGDFPIHFDKRDEDNFVEEILATLEGLLPY